jgi:hypothetical protein
MYNRRGSFSFGATKIGGVEIVRFNTTRGASQQQRIYAYLNAHIGVAREFTN